MSSAVAPQHYAGHPSGLQPYRVSMHLPHCLGSAFDYVARAGRKDPIAQDLAKALRWLDFEGERRGEIETAAHVPRQAGRRVVEMDLADPGTRSDALLAIHAAACNWMNEHHLGAAYERILAFAQESGVLGEVRQLLQAAREAGDKRCDVAGGGP